MNRALVEEDSPIPRIVCAGMIIHNMHNSISMRANLLIIIGLCLAQPGCKSMNKDAFQPVYIDRSGSTTRYAYSVMDRAGFADYWETRGEDGRVTCVDFGTGGTPGPRVSLEDIDLAHWRHLVLLLDGIPYDMMEEAYRQGMFRKFYPPVRLYSLFPSMTWVTFPEIFGSLPPDGIEPEYYDLEADRLSNGSAIYLKHRNVSWRPLTDYHAGFVVETLSYIAPSKTLSHELRQVEKRFENSDKNVMIFYVSSTAGIATKHGKKGIMQSLSAAERLCNEIFYRSGGEITITILSDHGHSLTPGKRAKVKRFLKSRGYRISKKIEGEKDVVVPKFGLVTYAGVNTRIPDTAGRDLVDLEGADLVIYRDGDSIVVRNTTGFARISKRGDMFRYEAERGDPLALLPLMEKLREEGKTDSEGFVADTDLFLATSRHEYPDPLHRIWHCWHGMVPNPPDVIVSFKDDYFWGSRFLDFWAKVASTHGSLNYRNSVTVVMTTAGPLPPLLRPGDVREALIHHIPFPP